MLTSIATIAAAITALVGLALKIWLEQKRKAAMRQAELLNELSVKIQAAKTDEERQTYVKELYRLRSK